MITRLSTLQYNMLRMFASQPVAHHMSIATAQGLDQRPFRSMLLRRWVAYTPGRGFRITRAGTDAFRGFENHSIERKNPSLPLTSYFDPAVYGLPSREKRKKGERRSGGLKAVA